MCKLVLNIRRWAIKEPLGDFAGYLEMNQKPLVIKINQMGFNIVSVWKDLVNPKPEIAAKLPLLVDILIEAIDDESLHPRIIAGVVRVLGNKNIVVKNDLYESLWIRYRKIPPSIELKNPQARGVDQSFAESLSMQFKLSYLKKHMELIFDENLQESRGLLLIALSKNMDNKNVKELLVRLLDHPFYHKEVEVILKKARKERTGGR